MSTVLSHTPSESYEPIEAGNHTAICTQLIDLGTQTEKAYESDENVLNHKIRLTWELPHETYEYEDKESGEKHTVCRRISKEFKASLHEKASLRKALASWRGRDFTEDELKGFDLANILGKTCMLNITHTEKGDKKYANIAAFAPLAKGMEAPKIETELIHYSIEDGYNDTYRTFPEFIKNKINAASENKTKTPADPSEMTPAMKEAGEALANLDPNDLEVDMPF